MLLIQPAEKLDPFVRQFDFVAVLVMPLLSHVAGHDRVNKGLLWIVRRLKVLNFRGLAFADNREPKFIQDLNLAFIGPDDFDPRNLPMDPLDRQVFQ